MNILDWMKLSLKISHTLRVRLYKCPAELFRDSPTATSFLRVSFQFSSVFGEIDKILVRWCDGKSKGTTSFIKKSAVRKGNVAVGRKVVVEWGKSKKMYNAEVMSVSNVQVPATVSRIEEKELFTFELAAPAQQAPAQQAPA